MPNLVPLKQYSYVYFWKHVYVVEYGGFDSQN